MWFKCSLDYILFYLLFFLKQYIYSHQYIDLLIHLSNPCLREGWSLSELLQHNRSITGLTRRETFTLTFRPTGDLASLIKPNMHVWGLGGSQSNWTKSMQAKGDQANSTQREWLQIKLELWGTKKPLIMWFNWYYLCDMWLEKI